MVGLSSTFDAREWQRVVAGALGWWRDAGVDGAVSVRPRPWLDRAATDRPQPKRDLAPPARPAASRPTLGSPPAVGEMPNDLAAFRAWAARAALPGVPTARRVVAGWAERAEVAVVVAMTARPDSILEPAAEHLLTAMMGAIGRSPTDTALLPVAPAPVGPRLTPPVAEALHPVLMRHLTLTGCRRALLLGEGPCRALLGRGAPGARGRWHFVNHDGAELHALATLDLATLLTNPACKREAWADLQLFDKGPTA